RAPSLAALLVITRRLRLVTVVAGLWSVVAEAVVRACLISIGIVRVLLRRCLELCASRGYRPSGRGHRAHETRLSGRAGSRSATAYNFCIQGQIRLRRYLVIGSQVRRWWPTGGRVAQLEARMHEFADQVARDGTNAAREGTSTRWPRPLPAFVQFERRWASSLDSQVGGARICSCARRKRFCISSVTL